MSTTLLIVHWQWGPETPFAGSSFWAVHNIDVDGRIADWPKEGNIPIGASLVTVTDGEGLELLLPTTQRTEALRKERGWSGGSVRQDRAS